MTDYQLFTDATADLSESFMVGLPKVEVIPMKVEICGKEYLFGPGGNISAEEFYALLRKGNFASTSQINPTVYFSYFEPALRAGKDIIYIGFSSGMSGTINAARTCAEELQREFPERKIICIDSLCASVGEGFLVREAAKKQVEAFGYEELVEWVLWNREKVCHWFTVDVFDHLKHGGRVSSTTAVAGTLINVKPLLKVDNGGKLELAGKPRGQNSAIKTQISIMKNSWNPENGKLVIIGHGDSPQGAVKLQQAVQNEFPKAETYIADIGPIIGAHTGPGILALIYWGSGR